MMRHTRINIYTVRLDGLDLEMHADQREDKTFEILHQVVERAQAFWVFAVVHVNQTADLRCGE